MLKWLSIAKTHSILCVFVFVIHWCEIFVPFICIKSVGIMYYLSIICLKHLIFVDVMVPISFDSCRFFGLNIIGYLLIFWSIDLLIFVDNLVSKSFDICWCFGLNIFWYFLISWSQYHLIFRPYYHLRFVDILVSISLDICWCFGLNIFWYLVISWSQYLLIFVDILVSISGCRQGMQNFLGCQS